MAIHFITYGDQKFLDSRNRVASEAESTNLFDSITVYTESICEHKEIREAIQKSSEFAEVFSSPRGGGYWIWKPYIILRTLHKIAGDDILVYTDAGSTIPKDDDSLLILKGYFDIVRESSLGLIGFRNPYKESKWTKGDVFHFFNTIQDETITQTRQFSAGRVHIARKCDYSMKIYQTWWDIAVRFPRLFDDTTSSVSNFPDFIEHRHDASVWSLICKTMGVEEIWDWNSIPIIPTRIRS